METKSCYVKYDKNTFTVLLKRILDSKDEYEKNKVLDMLSYYIFDNENICRTLIEFSVGILIPEPFLQGTHVKINKEHVGWLSTSDKEILEKSSKNDELYGDVITFRGYHSYNSYSIGFSEGIVDLPTAAILDISSIL